MNNKYKTLEWWIISIWFIVFGIWALTVVFLDILIPIILAILFMGIFGMIYCAAKEEEWFHKEIKKNET